MVVSTKRSVAAKNRLVGDARGIAARVKALVAVIHRGELWMPEQVAGFASQAPGVRESGFL